MTGADFLKGVAFAALLITTIFAVAFGLREIVGLMLLLTR